MWALWSLCLPVHLRCDNAQWTFGLSRHYKNISLGPLSGDTCHRLPPLPFCPFFPKDPGGPLRPGRPLAPAWPGKPLSPGIPGDPGGPGLPGKPATPDSGLLRLAANWASCSVGVPAEEQWSHNSNWRERKRTWHQGADSFQTAVASNYQGGWKDKTLLNELRHNIKKAYLWKPRAIMDEEIVHELSCSRQNRVKLWSQSPSSFFCFSARFP